MSKIRLTATYDPDSRQAEFMAHFAAPGDAGGAGCAQATLAPGDGAALELGELCAPAAVTWRRQASASLAQHTYSGEGPFTATLQWGDDTATCSVGSPAPVAAPAAAAPPALPQVSLFTVKVAAGNAQQAEVALLLSELAPDQHVRLDGGAGQAEIFSGAAGERSIAWSATYAKPGKYTVAVDLLDEDGFQEATLAEMPVELAEPEPAPPPAEVAAPLPAEAAAAPAEEAPADLAAAAAEPWLPFRYARPLWAGVRTYTAPGGGRVSRSVGAGSYFAIRQQSVVGGQLWYQTGLYDWVAASAVALLEPSKLRGVELGGPGPDPEPEPKPEPTPERRGIVTATVLNVRRRPGVSAGNPPIDSLRRGAIVTIYEESTVSGAVWYRIGAERWVHSGWVRLQAGETAAALAAAPAHEVTAAATSLPVGWIVAASLNVRSAPGANAPIAGSVAHNQAVSVLETRAAGGRNWHRIGANRWVDAGWVGVARSKPRPASIRANERWVGVNLSQQTLVAYEGDKPVYAALIASGLPGTPTVQGVFRTWWRVESRKMSGGSGAGYYYLEEVTWTCYFYSGYALHTAYWHDAFGRPRSHGCVNLSPYDAWRIFQWSAPGGANSPAVYVYWQ